MEREQAAKDAATERQRQEAIQSASRLAPWAKKAQNNALAHPPSNGGGHEGLSLAEIQKMEEERERELQMLREIEEQTMRELRSKQEEEERRNQVVIISYFYFGLSSLKESPFSPGKRVELGCDCECWCYPIKVTGRNSSRGSR